MIQDFIKDDIFIVIFTSSRSNDPVEQIWTLIGYANIHVRGLWRNIDKLLILLQVLYCTSTINVKYNNLNKDWSTSMTEQHPSGPNWWSFSNKHGHCLALRQTTRRILVPYIPSMSMTVIGHSLLYKDKDGAVCCMMFIDLLDDRWCLTGSKYLEYNSRNRQWTIKTVQ